MPTFDIPRISCLNNESKWVYLKFVQAGACCPLAIHNTQKAQLKQEGNKTSFSFAAQEQDTCAEGKEQRRRSKEQFVLG